MNPPRRNEHILPLRLYGDKVLAAVAAPVTEFDEALRAFIKDMITTMYARDGSGLAAPQVGVSKRIFVIDDQFGDTGEEKPMVFINPQIISLSGNETRDEGCLSLPNLWAELDRPDMVEVKAQDEFGREFSLKCTGLAARAVQHENDHLDGILFVDHLPPLRRMLLSGKLRQIKSRTDAEGNNILV